MARFRKKPALVEAVRAAEARELLVPGHFGEFKVRGRQGLVGVNPDDWLIAEQDGSGHYPCAPDVFAATYEPADA